MSHNLLDEKLYSLSAIAAFAPRNSRSGNKVSTSTIWRWTKRGLKAGDGTGGRVFLETVKAGGGLATSKEALKRFFAELTRRASPPKAPCFPNGGDKTPPGDRRLRTDVERQLDDAGF